MLREVLAVRKRVLGAEHPATLTTAHTLPTSLSRQGKHAEAEEMQRAVLAVRKRVLGGSSRHAGSRERHAASHAEAGSRGLGRMR